MIIVNVGCKLVVPFAYRATRSCIPDNVANGTAYVLISKRDIQ